MKFPQFRKNNKPIEEPTYHSDMFFELSYASWLVLPRIALQSMPPEWQARFFKLVREIEDTLEFPEGYTGDFGVTMRDNGKYVKGVMPHYRHNMLPRKVRLVKNAE